MSAEILAIVVSAVGIVLTLGTTMLAGFAWCVRRIDAVDQKLGARIDALDRKSSERSDRLEHGLGARIDAVDQKSSERSDRLEHNLGARIDALAADVTDLKIAVARLEGPVRHLIVPSS